MNATEWVIRRARCAAPTAEAADELVRFRAACAAGKVPAALAGLADGSDDPLWTALVTGATAAAADEVTWTAVCAAAAALATDERAVSAVAVGYEVADRVAAALGPAHTAAGWDVRATAGGIGAGAAAGWLCDLDDDALRNAIGLCATQAAGLTALAGTPAGAVQVGKAAGNAVEAALLAECGFTSAAEPLEGRRGMFALMSTGAELGAGWT